MPEESLDTGLTDALDGSLSHPLIGRSAPARRGPVVTLTRLLIASDALALLAALLVSDVVAPSAREQTGLQLRTLAAFAVMLPVWLIGAHLYGLYGVDGRPAMYRTAREWANLGHLVVIWTVAFSVVALATQIDDPARGQLLAFAVSAIAFLTAGRVASRALARRRDGYVQSAVIVGAGEVGQLIARKLLRHPEYGIDLVGFVDIEPKQLRPDIAHVPILGEVDDLASIVSTLGVDRVILAFSKHNDAQTVARVRQLAGLNVQIDVVPRMFEMMGPNAGLPDVEGIPLVSISPRVRSTASLRVKRAIDVAGASVALLVTSPVFLWAAWRIPRESPGSVFYRQTRLGANMQEFTMLKFRTMTTDADESPHHAYVEQSMNGHHTPDLGRLYKLDRRDVVTPTGSWLRKTSLDELPQLINVLQGTMSLVGPRPCLAYETEYFAAHHYERFLAPAGITGLWQVTARAHAGFAEALEMDVVYVRDWSLALDLSLILRTPIEVLRQRRATV
jgi:exopolysaccharide biosynthesis polyprenyl glycosylphosphotransferase